MRTIITALVAASALAQDMGDIQRAIKNLKRDIQNIPEEASKEVGDSMAPEGSQALADACWKEGKFWLWNQQRCVQQEEGRAIQKQEEKDNCAKEDYYWTERNGGWCASGTPSSEGWKVEAEQDCWQEGKMWVKFKDTCYEFEEGGEIQRQEDKLNCAKEDYYWTEKNGGGWCVWGTPSSEGLKYEAEQDCWSKGMYWVKDWEQCVDFEKGMKYDQEQMQQRCLDEGNAWNEQGWCEWKMLMRKAPHFSMQQIDLKRGATFERYSAARYANASAPVQAWQASFIKWTATQPTTDDKKYWCNFVGYTWDEAKKVCNFTTATTQSNPIGDVIKSTIANNTTVTVNGNEVPIQLAAKKPAAAKQSNYGTAFAGVTFGVIATLAAGAMVMTCSKKRVAANQEPFL